MNNTTTNKVLIIASGVLVIALIMLITIGVVMDKSGVFDALLGQTQKVTMIQDRIEKQKSIEDTCRAMIASYNIDKQMYQAYSTSHDPDRLSWGEQARLRANATAAQYNEYLLKNIYIFEGDTPDDIEQVLETLY